MSGSTGAFCGWWKAVPAFEPRAAEMGNKATGDPRGPRLA